MFVYCLALNTTLSWNWPDTAKLKYNLLINSSCINFTSLEQTLCPSLNRKNSFE